MDAAGSVEMVTFGEFRLAPHGSGLFRCVGGNHLVPISIGSRALAVLGVLVERAGEIVSKDEIMAAVWPGTVVEEANLSVQLSKLRRILDPDLHGRSHIQTVAGRGYRFTQRVDRLTRTIEKQAIEAPAVPQDAARPLTRSSLRNSASILLVILMVGVAWETHHLHARPAAYSAADRRRSVMVLPFENTSGDPAQDSLAAEITRDVTDNIATDSAVPIVSPTHPGGSVNLRSIGREYDVHFVLSGHAHRADGHVVVVATASQIYDERAVWTQSYDSPDRPDALRSIVQSIGDGFDLATEEAERARANAEHPDDLDKRDLLFAANAMSVLQPSAQNYLTRIALVNRALALDPNFVWALRKSAMLHAQLVLSGFSPDRDADLSIAIKAADRALMRAPNDVLVLKAKATTLRAGNDLRGAEALFRKVTELHPHAADSYIDLAEVLMEGGRYDAALAALITAQTLLAPPDDGKYFHLNIATALVANERYAEAIAPARLATVEFLPDNGTNGEPAWLALIAAEIENGQDADARADLQKFLDRPRHFHNLGAVLKSYRLATNQRLLDDLRRAGMPAD